MNDMPIFLRFSGIEYECPEKKKPSQPEPEKEEDRPAGLIWIFPDTIRYDGEPSAA